MNDSKDFLQPIRRSGALDIGQSITPSYPARVIDGPGCNGSDRRSLHLNQKELARRWRMSPRTLERWRWLREGPSYLKIGGKIIYRLTEVEAFEDARVRELSFRTQGTPSLSPFTDRTRSSPLPEDDPRLDTKVLQERL